MKRFLKPLSAMAAFGYAIANAAGPDLTSLQNALDPVTTVAAVLAVALALASIFVAIRAAKSVLGMIRGA